MIIGYDIIKHFERDPKSTITINKLAKTLKKSYGWTHKHANELIQEKILNAEEIGASTTLSLNFASNKTIGLLALATIERSERQLHGRETVNKAIKVILQHTTADTVCILVDEKDNITLVSHNQHRTHIIAGHDVDTADVHSFKPFQHLNDSITYGFEAFWRLAGGSQ